MSMPKLISSLSLGQIFFKCYSSLIRTDFTFNSLLVSNARTNHSSSVTTQSYLWMEDHAKTWRKKSSNIMFWSSCGQVSTNSRSSFSQHKENDAKLTNWGPPSDMQQTHEGFSKEAYFEFPLFFNALF